MTPRAEDFFQTAAGGPDMAALDESVRPRSLADFIGQDELRANLRSIAINCLASTKNQINLAHLFRCTAKCITCCQCIGAGKGTVGQQQCFICTAEQRVTKNIRGGRRPHGSHYHFGAVTVFKLQRQFKCVQVFRIENRRQGCTVDGTVSLHRLSSDVLCVRNLFYKHEYGITHSFSSLVFPLLRAFIFL